MTICQKVQVLIHFNVHIKQTLVVLNNYIDFTLFNYLLPVKGYACIDTFYLYINQTLDCIEPYDHFKLYPLLH